MLIDDVSEIVAKELNYSSDVLIKEINRIQWKFLHKEMQSGDFKSVNIFYLGKFFKNKKYKKNGRKPTKQERISGYTDL